MNGKCYVTICTNKRYLKGVLLLNKSLKMASSSFPLLCVVPNTIEQEVLSVLRDKRINVKQIDNGIILNENILESNRNSFYAHWNNTFF
jgi:hypothetical protein